MIFTILPSHFELVGTELPTSTILLYFVRLFRSKYDSTIFSSKKKKKK